MRRLQQALGSTALQLTDGERAYRHKAIKKVLALRDLAAGHVLGEGDIELKRTENVPPGQGLNDPALAIGRHLGRAVAAGSAILKADIR
ncbi:MAG: hypothetical protein CTR53_05410 [Ferrovibrio sp.]|nr:MAG: hypothetical protein CTR53_05410 [Ferrovibrio sp.]